MPSLDGYSLNEEIKKLRADVTEKLLIVSESLKVIFSTLQRLDKPVVKKAKKGKKIEEKASA